MMRCGTAVGGGAEMGAEAMSVALLRAAATCTGLKCGIFGSAGGR